MTILYTEKAAVISDCKKYRYMLRRSWDHNKMRFLFIMLNPSTADADIDDPTIRSCTRLSNALGAGSFEVVNLFAFRATDPKELHNNKYEENVGSDNGKFIGLSVQRCDLSIVAWGAHELAVSEGKKVVKEILTYHRPAVFCLGKTKSNAPKHPLYIKTGQQLETYRQL